ncbi:gamma-glutamyl-gamma-aminobutyrate hydrolase family protein [Paenibacillus sp. GCM10027626]|uniref:gamma-glutamyl-gamma-aminobutyrate hydrolase family protein n=1 Tax=Paenibacillus sp. GCM10027626 TaxID=3273411 RepID=UPI003636674F
MRPLVAITMNHEEISSTLRHAYVDSIVRAGGIPFLVPAGLDEEAATQISLATDGLLLTGGHDVDPNLYGEPPAQELGEVTPERDALEVMLIRAFLSNKKPIFAICRGAQILNVALGGTLYQDVHVQLHSIQHQQKSRLKHYAHPVSAVDDSLLRQLVGKETFRVNSIHHQAVKSCPASLRISAMAEDGVVEAIEGNGEMFVLGVQWHPEATEDDVSRKLFEGFVEACLRQTTIAK